MYQTFNATGPADLIDKIAQAIPATGWTVHRNVLNGSVRLATFKRDGDYIHFWNDSGNIYMRGSIGYDGAAAGSAQPKQAPGNRVTNVGAGPFANVFLFADNVPSEHVFIVVEVSAGRFRHMSFGQLVKSGAYTGGTWFDGFWWLADGLSYGSHDAYNGYSSRMFDSGTLYGENNTGFGAVHCDYDGRVDNWAAFRSKNNAGSDNVVVGGMGGQVSSDNFYNNYASQRTTSFYDMSANSFSGQTPLQPIEIRAARPGGYWSTLGEVPNIRFCNMARITVGEEVTIGSDVWKVFPWIRKGTSGAPQYLQSSANLAYAYKKVL